MTLQRVVIAVVLVVALVGLGVIHDVTGESRWPYPSTDDIREQPEQYVGEEMVISGPVTGINGSTVTVRVKYTGGTYPLTVTGVDTTVQPGGNLQVYGTVQPGPRIDAQRAYVVNQAGSSRIYKYVVSLLGVAVFLLQFFRHWRVNPTEWTLEARSDG